MIQIEPFETHIEEYEAWFEKYPEVYQSELLAIKYQFEQLPENIRGIEVGLGSGRFAEPLGIREGVEPAENMRLLAIKRGIEVMNAPAENLPYKDLHFDFVLFVTICHLDNVSLAFKEANRVLKRSGSIIVGFIDRDGKIGRAYEQKKATSTFYRQANFYSVDEVNVLLKEAGFKNPIYVQTLFDELENINQVEEVKEGYGEGSFVVVRATK